MDFVHTGMSNEKKHPHRRRWNSKLNRTVVQRKRHVWSSIMAWLITSQRSNNGSINNSKNVSQKEKHKLNNPRGHH